MEEQEAEDELGDRPVEDAAGVRDDDVGVDQVVEEQRVNSGGGHVDPSEVVGTVELSGQRRGEVVPEQEHIGARQSVAELIGTGGDADLDVLEVPEVTQAVGNPVLGCRENRQCRHPRKLS
ncbi:Uncharacterised protein [Mycobacteroides abscessus subsp. abscessus]|nr:Uncharacterised protein [Mycobacteroides abscessus subsp. abscessus]